jgi:hypothetical protein
MNATASTKPDRWVPGIINWSEAGAGISQARGILRDNIGIYHRNHPRFPKEWAVFHQPSGLGFFRADTRAVAVSIIDHIKHHFGLDFIDRCADGTYTKADEEIGRRVKEFIRDHPRARP